MNLKQSPARCNCLANIIMCHSIEPDRLKVNENLHLLSIDPTVRPTITALSWAEGLSPSMAHLGRSRRVVPRIKSEPSIFQTTVAVPAMSPHLFFPSINPLQQHRLDDHRVALIAISTTFFSLEKFRGRISDRILNHRPGTT